MPTWETNKFFLLAVGATLLAVFTAIGTAVVYEEEQSLLSDLKFKKLYCFDSSTVELVQSTVGQGCEEGTLSLGAAPIRNPEDEVSEIDPLLLNRFTAAKAMGKMEGISLNLTSGYRSKEKQAALYRQEIKLKGSETEAMKWVLPPEYSHHPMGTAIDVNYAYDREATRWLEKFGYIYGLCRVYKNEWWHFEGVIAPGEKCPGMKENALVDAYASSGKYLSS